MFVDRRKGHEASQGGSAGPEPASVGAAQGGSAEPRRTMNADALVGMAEASLAGGPGVRPAGERHQVVVHVDAEALAQEAKAGSHDGGGARCCELGDGPRVSADTARRLACDASLVGMVAGSDGALDVGRKTRAIPPAIRRALEAREPCCQFPGCENRRWVDAHHIVHWANGGETKVDNLVRLCTHHHRMVHEGGFSVARRSDGELVFRKPSGEPIPVLPSPIHGRCEEVRNRNRKAGIEVGSETVVPLSRGGRIDYGLAVWGLARRAEPRAGP